MLGAEATSHLGAKCWRHCESYQHALSACKHQLRLIGFATSSPDVRDRLVDGAPEVDGA